MTLELSPAELAVVEDALEKYVIDKDEYLDMLEDMTYDGMYVSEWDWEDAMINADTAHEILIQIDEVWYEHGYVDDDEDPFWEIFDDGWDDIEEYEEAEEEELVDA